MTSEWDLLYPSYMIADGEPDFEVDQCFDWFAVEFWTEGILVRTDERSKSAVPIADYKYRVVAELVYLSEKACIIDFGLKAIRTADLLSPECKQGDYVTGQISIGLPLCTEMVPEEVLNTLAHKWHVNRISADLTPYVAQPENSRFHIRDESKIRHQDINSTKALSTHTYILHCSEIA